MSTKKFNETKLAEDMVKNFAERLHGQLQHEDAQMFICRIVESGVRYLAKYKVKEAPVAISFKTLDTNNEFLFGLIASYTAPEEGASEEMPGSWNVAATMNEADLAEARIVYDLQNTAFCNEMVAILSHIAHIRLSRPNLFAQIAATVFGTMKAYLEGHAAKSTEEQCIELDNFSVSCKKEADGTFTTGIFLDSDLKRYIKDDTALEENLSKF